MFCLSLWLKAKNPRLTGNRGFLKILNSLTFHSHDARKTGALAANGHPAIDRRKHQFYNRVVHFLTWLNQFKDIANTLSRLLSKRISRKLPFVGRPCKVDEL